MSVLAPSPTTSTSSAAAHRWLTRLLTIDAIGSGVVAVVLVAWPAWLADALGLTSVTGVRVVGVLFALNVVANGVPARQPSRRSLAAPIAIDTTFGLVLVVLALAGWSGGGAGARWAVAVVGMLSLDLAFAKVWGRRRV